MGRAAMALAVLGLALSGASQAAEAKPRDTRKARKTAERAERRMGAVSDRVRLGFAPRRAVRLPANVPPPIGPAPAAGPAPGASSAPWGSAIAAPSPVIVPPPAGPPLPPPIPPLSRTVSVRSTEFAFALSRPLVGAGRVAVEFNNSRAEDPHDLWIARSGSADVGRRLSQASGGKVTSAETDLGPGAFKLYCSLPGHEQLGMKATLRVETG